MRSVLKRPPVAWGELVEVHDDRDGIQASPDELPVIDINTAAHEIARCSIRGCFASEATAR